MGKFIKGVSGNPSGRPHLGKDIRDLAKQYSKEMINVLADIATDREERGSVRVQAIEVILNRAWGTTFSAKHVTDDVEHTITELTTNELCTLLAELRSNNSISSIESSGIVMLEKT